MTKLDEMWDALAEYQSKADDRGHGESWAKMCELKTEKACRDADYAAFAGYAAGYAEAAAGYAAAGYAEAAAGYAAGYAAFAAGYAGYAAGYAAAAAAAGYAAAAAAGYAGYAEAAGCSRTSKYTEYCMQKAIELINKATGETE